MIISIEAYSNGSWLEGRERCFPLCYKGKCTLVWGWSADYTFASQCILLSPTLSRVPCLIAAVCSLQRVLRNFENLVSLRAQRHEVGSGCDLQEFCRSRCTVIERNWATRGTVIEFESLRMERCIVCTNFLGVECSMINGFSLPVSFSMPEWIPSIMYAIVVVYSGREWCPYYASHTIANVRCLVVRDFHQHLALTHNLKLVRAILILCAFHKQLW